jgi:hypothetical protein
MCGLSSSDPSQELTCSFEHGNEVPGALNVRNFIMRSFTAAAQSEAGTVFFRSNIGVVGSNPTRSMDVSVCLFCVFIILCVDSDFARADPTSKETY